MTEDNEAPASAVEEAPAETPAPPAIRKRGWTDHQITIRSAERIREAYVFAQQNKLLPQFCEGFMQMLSLISGFHKEADDRDYDLRGEVCYDGSKHSFAWHVEAIGPLPDVVAPPRPRVPFMVGALIYHGKGSGETFAMLLGGSANDNPWAIHT